ncbi:MAG: oligosaccharide flippase family protein, partial [Candidatus Latescibacterota bacterium]
MHATLPRATPAGPAQEPLRVPRPGLRSLLARATVRQGLLSLVDQMAASACNFATAVVIGRTCSKEEFGLYALTTTVVFFAAIVQTSLISMPYVVYGPRLAGPRRRRYLGSVLLHQLGYCALAALLLAAAGAGLALGIGPPRLAPLAWAVAGALVFILMREQVRRICLAQLRMGTALLLDAGVLGLQLAGLVLLGRLEHLSAGGAYGLMGAACGASALAWLVANRKSFEPRLGEALGDLRQSWSLGRWMALSGVLWAVCADTYPWLLAAFHGTGAAAVWAACAGLRALCNPLVMGVTNYLGPALARQQAVGGSAALRPFVFRSAVVFAALAAPCC